MLNHEVGMLSYLRLFISVLICVVLVGTLQASDLKAVENKAKMEFHGKTLLMSHYYVSNKLHFNSSGALVGQSEEGTWPTNGLVHVDDVEVKHNLVRRRGKTNDLRLPHQDGNEALTTRPRRKTVGSVLHEENYGRKMNEYWHGLAKIVGVDPKSGQMTIQGGADGVYGYLGERAVYFPNPPIEPPKVTHKEETDYTKAAAVKRTQGLTFMLVIINEKGYPEFLHLIKDLGDDLDVQSMAGTSQWRFRPATKDGKPVACVIRVGWEFTSLY